MQKSFFIMLPDNKMVHLQGTSLEEVSRVFSSWPKDTQQEMAKGQLYLEDENGKLVATEFIKSPEKENEIVLPLKLKKTLVYLVLPLGTLYLLGFWAGLTLVFFYSLPWLSKKLQDPVKKLQDPVKWWGVVVLAMGTVCIIGNYEGPVTLPLGKEDSIAARDTVMQLPSKQISCDSAVKRTLSIKFKDSIQITKGLHLTGIWMFGATERDTLRYTYKVLPDTVYSRAASPLERFCGDTVVSKKYKPYEDRNFSLVKVNKKYYDANYRLVDTTYYQNLSPKIGAWELEDIFKGTEAEWKHSIRVAKYTLAMLDGGKVDTLGTKEDAQSLLEAKCRDRATVEQRLVYAELDACLKNNKIQRIHVQEERGCGINPVRLSYARGSVSSYPYRCNESASWTYSRYLTLEDF